MSQLQNLLVYITINTVRHDWKCMCSMIIILYCQQYYKRMQDRQKQYKIEYNDILITIDSKFDSGNLEQAALSNNVLILTPSLDPINTHYSSKQSSKTFFHFSIKATQKVNMKVAIKQMKILQYFNSVEQFQEYFRICVGHMKKKGWQQAVEYQKMQLQNMRRVEVDSNYQLHFNLDIGEEQVYLAYHYPYSFERSQALLHTIKEKVNIINEKETSKIYYRSELLIQSLERRPVNLITLTGENKMADEEESRISKSIFPFFEIEGRPKKFNKPYIFFTCRVHPGETSSSFILEGILEYLLTKSKKASILLQNFVFIIIPVLNPDGVYYGTYRMDTLGHNLNRFYNSAQSHKQPSVFAVHTLVHYYGNRIIFFMDFHSHPHPNKGSFIYGNSLELIQQQLQSQMFAKNLSLVSQCFSYNWCNYSANQMHSRDINETLTKDGCARVQIYKILDIPFSFTMEIGYHGCSIKVKEKNTYYDSGFSRASKIFSIEDYKDHGKSIVLSIFNIFVLNTSLGIKSKHGKHFQEVREELLKEMIQKEERFRLADTLVFKKIKIINEIVLENIYHPIFKKYSSLQRQISRYFLIQRVHIPHSLSHQHAHHEEKQVLVLPKKQLSLQMKNASKTIEPLDYHSLNQELNFQTFKSTIDTKDRSEQSSINSYSPDKEYKYARMLNLDFNPFPSMERKKIYSIMGLRKFNKRKNEEQPLYQIQREYEEINHHTAVDKSLSSRHNKVQKAQQLIQQIFQENKISPKIKQVSSFSGVKQQEGIKDEGYEYLDVNYQKYQKKWYDEKFLLPKIHSTDKSKDHFNIQINFLKQIDKKYNVREVKDRAPFHTKASLRNNGLKMKSLVRSIK